MERCVEKTTVDRPATGTSGRHPTTRVPARVRALATAGGLLLALLAAAPDALVAQQDTTGARPEEPADSVAAPAPGDTIAADTTLTPRERALRRLRAMRTDPVQPDSLHPDSLPSDSLPSDSLPSDSLPSGSLPSDSLLPDSLGMDPAELGGAELDTAALGELDEQAILEAARDPRRRMITGEDPRSAILEEGAEPRDPVIREDSVRALLRSLPGYSATEYTGDAAVFRAEINQLELTGTSKVTQAENSLSTDSLLVYDGETGIVCGYGEPVLTGQGGDPVTSTEVCFDIERNLGVAAGARTTFQQGATWFVRGANNRVFLLTGGEGNTLYGERTEFTSCELDHPHYTFQAQSLKMMGDEVMVARDITLKFEDVPVFWLPWMVQSMKRGRRSGVLMPQFGMNDIVRNSDRYRRNISNIGFYWAINDYLSTKATFGWFSGNYTSLEGALTYRWLRQFLRGSLTTRQYWREREGLGSSRELTLNTSNSWEPDERTRIQLNANYATSADFVREQSFDPQELNRRITSNASVSRSFSWGSMSLGADRSEHLSTGQVDTKLPGLSMNLSPLTLYQGEDLSVTWNGSGSVTRQIRDVVDTVATRDTENIRAQYNHSLSLGRLGLGQRVNWTEDIQGARPELFRQTDTLPFLPGTTTQTMTWGTSLSYQQPLWAGTTVSPRISIDGNQVRSEATEGEFVAAPNRVSAGANLNTSIYGFWPGFARFSRVRHKISPSLSWSYSPEPTVTARQEEIFGVANLRAQNRLTLSFNQTFEAKVRETSADTAGAAAGDGREGGEGGEGGEVGEVGEVGEGGEGQVGRDDREAPELAVSVSEGGAPGEPRRLPQSEKVMLLALDTRTSFVYDFVAAEEDGRGFLTDNISNSIRSDLLRGLQVSTTHSLFETQAGEPGTLAPRTFAPFLTDLSASFSIDNNFWLFEFLGLTGNARDPAGPGRSSAPGAPAGPGDDPEADGFEDLEDGPSGAEADPDQLGGARSVVPSGGRGRQGPQQGVGGWRASLSYSLRRQRPVLGLDPNDSQLLTANLSFQPTELWSVRWNTAYSFTDREFANHVLTLSRDLHRWQANFDFIKAQNGNFAMQFRVQLRDNPDLKLDYDQRTDPSQRGIGARAAQ